MPKSTNPDFQVDIVVVGAGVAGLSAALTAQEQGSKEVLVLEALKAPGGSSLFAEGLFAIQDQGINAEELNILKDRLLQTSMSYTHHRIDPFLVRILVDESSRSLHWLEGKGFSFVWQNVFHGSDAPLYASDIKFKTKTGAAVIKAMVKECHEKGISVLCETRARQLLTDDTGKVVGLIAERGHKRIRISAGSVILASGGFGGNKDLLKHYIPAFSEAIGLCGAPTQGDGLLMASEAGADTQDEIVLEMEGPAFPWTRELSLSVTAHQNTIWVNSKGRRFAQELFNPFECANSLMRQPGQVSFTLMDEDIKNSIVRDEIDHIGEPVAKKDGTLESKLDKMLRLHAAKGRIKIANTWNEIAEWAGLPPKSLKATIKEYNSYCANKHDAQFKKNPSYLMPLRTPPFYAIHCNPTLLVTHGGIKIDSEMRVLDKSAEPIPGLFAAGIDTGGVDADTYNYNLPGHSFGFALSSGRLAGCSASRYCDL